MPCNSDYMYPTQSEIQRLHDKELLLKGVADKMVFNADVIRDVLLENKGKLSSATAAFTIGQVGKMVGAFDALVTKGDRILDDMKSEYAWRQGYDSTTGVYEKAKDQYAYVIGIARRFLDGQKIYAKEYKNVEAQQIAHRKGDIQRLVTVFNDRGDWVMLRKVINVDFNKPLEPQLGFSPDDY